MLGEVDDATVGRALRALRIQKGLTQAELAAFVGVGQTLVSRAERGKLANIPFGTTRALFGAVEAGCNLVPWWRSGDLDRLLDEDHAALAFLAIRFLERHGWTVSPEVSFSIYAERGSIDLLATRRSDGAVL